MSDEPEDYGIRLLKKIRMPVTRENYIAVAWGGNPPDPWTPEDEETLPESLQDFSVFGSKMEEAMYTDDTTPDPEDEEDRDYEDED